MSQSPQTHVSYRPDIDGLRALAVIAVIIFHAFPKVLRGGFVGVDIFFVISGFLISSIIFQNLVQGHFSFAAFYARRIRRIFPALALMLVACFAFGWLALLADEFRQFGKHMAASAGFVQNLVLWKEFGYFDNASETKPLLHIWSLGIEEQFYLIWPLFVWLAWRNHRLLPFVIAIVGIASFAWNMASVGKEAVFAFYTPQTRFWELLSGSLLAWANLYRQEALPALNVKLSNAIGLIPTTDQRGLRNLFSLTGMTLLFFGFWWISKYASFPGWKALIPVLGTVLIIAAGKDAWLNRVILSNTTVVEIGLISFPLYLWHWPLLSFARIIEGETPSVPFRLTAIIIALILAVLTFEFIEKPIRHGGHGAMKATLCFALMVAIGGMGWVTYQQDGFAQRPHATLSNHKGSIGHLAYHRYVAEKYYRCTPERLAQEALQWEGFTRCMQSKPSSVIDIALLGDSHAEHLFPGMATALPNKNIVFYNKGTPPFTSNPEYKDIFPAVVADPNIKIVVFAMRWSEKVVQVPSGSSLESEILKVIDPILDSGKTVYLTDDVPSFIFQPEQCKGKRWLATKAPTCEITIQQAQRERDRYIDALKKVIDMRPQVKFIPVWRYICGTTACSMVRDDTILYRDSSHLNLEGSLYVGKKLVEDNPELFN